MSKQVINIGSSANDGTGESQRSGFNKTNLNFAELYNGDNPNIAPPNALGALAINTAQRLNTKSISVDSTFTFSGTPTTGTWFALRLANSDTAGHVITIPSSYSLTRQAAVTTLYIPLSGKLLLEWYYDGSTYILVGDPLGVIPQGGDYTVSIGKGAGDSATADFSVFLGFNAGKNYPSAGQAVCIGYQAGQSAGGYACTYVGYQAGATASDAGAVSNVFIGYNAGASATAVGSSVFLGVHAGEAATGAGASTFIGYHTGESATGASGSVIIGDHAATTGCASASNCIFLGPYSGVNRAHTIWIDTEGASIGGRIPLLYGETDNRKWTIAGSQLIEPAASTNNAAVASAALEVKSTAKGFLPPRMTKTQRDAISSPATGLAVFQTDNTPGLRVYNGTNWMKYTEATD